MDTNDFLAKLGGEIAGKAIEKGVDVATKAYKAIVGDHESYTDAQAIDNIQEFLIGLHNRVTELEKKPKYKKHIKKVLKSASFRMAVHEAMKVAAASEGKIKKELLSEFLEQQLETDVQSTNLMLYKEAVNITGSLAGKHVKILALKYFIDLCQRDLEHSNLVIMYDYLHIYDDDSVQQLKMPLPKQVLKVFDTLDFDREDLQYLQFQNLIRKSTTERNKTLQIGVNIDQFTKQYFKIIHPELTSKGHAYIWTNCTKELLFNNTFTMLGKIVGEKAAKLILPNAYDEFRSNASMT